MNGISESSLSIEEVLFEEWSQDWNMYMPTKLLFYSNRNMELLCQTGDHHERSVRRAEDILRSRGLFLTGEDSGIGTKGIYYHVSRVGEKRIMKNNKRYYLAISRCPNHTDFFCVSMDHDSGGTRLTPSKCCGQWNLVKSWPLNVSDLRKIISECENAIKDLESE